MTMVAEESVLDVPSLIDAVNAALEMGDWAQVVVLTVPLYSAAIAVGDSDFAELVQDVHWIANDALARPLEVARLVQA